MFDRKSYMKVYNREYGLLRREKRKQEALSFLGGCCKQCNATEELEFDHIDPKDKVACIGAIASFSDHRFWEEVRKCQLLCKECHRIKTAETKAEKSFATCPHGMYRYRRWKCRCEMCLQARRKEDAKSYYRKKSKLALHGR